MHQRDPRWVRGPGHVRAREQRRLPGTTPAAPWSGRTTPA